MQTIDRRKFNSGLFLGIGLAGCANATPELPDLIVTGIRWSEDDGATWHTGPIRAGSDVWFEADVKNQGLGPTPHGAIIGVGFRANGTLVAWSDDYTQSLSPNAIVRLRANGGPDSDRDWNNVQVGSYTINALVDGPSRIVESDESENTHEILMTVEAGTHPTRVTIGSVSGAGNILISESGSYKITDLPALHCAIGRVGCYPQFQYYQGNTPTPANFDAVVLAMLAKGVQPYFSLNYDPSMNPADTGIPDRQYSTWFDVGAALATRFEADSLFLTGKGITGIGMYGIAAFNEPGFWSGSFSISTSEYHDMLKGLADGVHSVNTNLPVYPGGMANPDANGDYTEDGYISAIADLVNDGTLAGIDVHIYHRGTVGEIITNYNNSQQFAVDAVISACGITRADANYICTEVGMRTEPEATADGYDEKDARNWFLTALFDVWATTRPNGTWSDGPRFPWNLWRQGNGTWYMAQQTSPRIERWHGHTYSMLMDIVHDMAFVSTDPRDTGVHKLEGGGKTAWVFQNTGSGWSSLFGSTFTISDIPDAATQVEVYDGNGLIETVSIPGTNHVFSTPTGRSYLFIANAEA